MIGDQLRQSSKQLFREVPAPKNIRCLMVGFDRDVIPDGELLKAFVIVSAGAAPGQAQVRLKNTFATDPGGNAVTLGPSVLNIQVKAADSFPDLLGLSGVLNAASLLPGPVAPGEIITLFGSLSKQDSKLFFMGIPAPIVYAGSNHVNAVVPFELDVNAPANLEIRTGDRSTRFAVPVAPLSPGNLHSHGRYGAWHDFQRGSHYQFGG